MLKKLIIKSFIMFLAILAIMASPQVGYRPLALQLLYRVPATLGMIYALFIAHASIRSKSLGYFIEKQGKSSVDKFEHAKSYYALFVILTFIALSASMFIGILSLWDIPNGFNLLIEALQNKLVITLGDGIKVGFIEFTIFTLFIASGFCISSALSRFVLADIYDVLYVKPGLRHTISSITHYAVIYACTVLGLSYIQLLSLVFWVNSVAAVGVGFAAKDFIADFIAGFLVLIERPVEIGDKIETGKVSGTIKKISARSTIIITTNNDIAIIPNRELLGKTILKHG